MPIDKNSPWFLVIAAVIGIAFVSVMIAVQPRELTERFLQGNNDFMQFYAGARLSGAELYSREAKENVERELGVQTDNRICRLPFYSLFLKPLALLPYRTAYYCFEAISLISFLVFLWMFVPACRPLAVFASLSVPLFANFENGQDVTLCLMFAGLSIFLARRNLDFWAGLALSLCAIKFHMFTLVPLIVIIQRRWRIFFGGAAGGATLIGISYLRAGMDWPRGYIAAVGDSGFSPSPAIMPNIHSLSGLMSGPAELALEAVLSIAVVGSVIYLARKTADYELSFAYALIGGLLISVHAYIADCSLLLLPLAIVLSKPVLKIVRDLTEMVISPIPYFFLLVGAPFNLVMPLLMAILGLAVTAREADKQADSDRRPVAANAG